MLSYGVCNAENSITLGSTPLIQLPIEKYAKPMLHDCNFTL